MISFLSINVSKQLLTSNKTHKRIKRLWCFYKIKPETEGNAGMMSLIGDTRTRSVSWLKLLISLDLNILGIIWDNVSTQINKIYNIVLVVFEYFNPYWAICSKSWIWIRMIWIWKSHVSPGSGNPSYFCAGFSKQNWIGSPWSRYTLFKNTKSGLLALYGASKGTWWLKKYEMGGKKYFSEKFCVAFAKNFWLVHLLWLSQCSLQR